jgi:phage terminase small subunit
LEESREIPSLLSGALRLGAPKALAAPLSFSTKPQKRFCRLFVLGIKLSPDYKNGRNERSDNATEDIKRKGVCGMAGKLTDKQKLFVQEYLIDLNATQAYIRAGYKNYDSAGVEAGKALKNPKIKAAIDEAMAERSRRTGINQDRVIRELAKMAFVNISDVVDLDTATVNEDASKEDLACIQSVKIKPTEFGTEREIKFYDKKGSLELLGKHLGLFRDKLDVEADMNLTITVDYGDAE